ncbi:hypothetical protein HZC09_05660 [Candidatus Micrarchaeota archaeon]|nr:hypothetical protein [Candidatus Micrarchaeota archaeon]
MVFSKAIEKFKTIVSRKQEAPKAIEDKSIEEKKKRLESEAETKAREIVPEIMKHSKLLKHSIRAVANKQIEKEMQFYKIAAEHQRAFGSRMDSIQRQLEALEFPQDYAGMVAAQGKLAELLTAANKTVVNNRYVYAFFEKELKEFNQSMKSLLELNQKLAETLGPAYAFRQKIVVIEAERKKITGIGEKRDFLRNQMEGAKENEGKLVTEKNGLLKNWNEEEYAEASEGLENAIAENKNAEGAFQSFLGSIEGKLKKYAHGREKGAYAATAERYLHDAKAFIGDSEEGSSEIPRLFGVLLEKNEIQEYESRKTEWVERLKKARGELAAREQNLRQMESKKGILRSIQQSIDAARQEKELLEKKIAELDGERKRKEDELAEEEKRVLEN